MGVSDDLMYLNDYNIRAVEGEAFGGIFLSKSSVHGFMEGWRSYLTHLVV